MDSLEDVLQGVDATAVPVETEQEPQEAPKGETIEDTAPPAEPEQPKHEESPEVAAFKTKALDEKRKRQSLEEQNRALLEQLQQIQQPKEEVDYWDDPEKALDMRVNSEVERVSQAFNQKFNALAEDMTKSKYQDYDDVADYFLEVLAPQNPGLVEQARGQVNPYEFIYKTTKAQKELAEVGDIDALKAKLRAEVLAEIKVSGEAEAKKLAEIPGSLAGQRGTAAPTGAELGSDSLEDILGR